MNDCQPDGIKMHPGKKMWCHLWEAGPIKAKFKNQIDQEQTHFSPGNICRKHLRRCDMVANIFF